MFRWSLKAIQLWTNCYKENLYVVILFIKVHTKRSYTFFYIKMENLNVSDMSRWIEGSLCKIADTTESMAQYRSTMVPVTRYIPLLHFGPRSFPTILRWQTLESLCCQRSADCWEPVLELRLFNHNSKTLPIWTRLVVISSFMTTCDISTSRRTLKQDAILFTTLNSIIKLKLL